MTAPTTPHLAWGGTDCPGARWREWVPQLRERALQEDTMPDEHSQHHQQLADRMKVMEDYFGAHMQAHQGTFDPNLRQLNDRVGALERRPVGSGGIKRGDTVKLV